MDGLRSGDAPAAGGPAGQTSVHAIYRLAPTRKSEVRPGWFNQTACLATFVDSVEAARAAGIGVRTTAVIDGDIDASLEPRIAWFESVHRIQLRGNSTAFRFALAVALAAEESTTIFAEDDYMWTKPAIAGCVAVLDAVPRAVYASPYRHPLVDDLALPAARRHRMRRFVVDGTEWRTTPSTTMTFAARTSELRHRQHYWQLATHGRSPKDGYAFRALLDGRWFRLVGNAAFRDVRRVVNIATLRVIAESVSRRLRPGTRPLLLQPVDGLATHVHQPFITGSADWAALAASVGETP